MHDPGSTPRRRPRRSRETAAAALLAAAVLLAGGCGEARAPGGSGRLEVRAGAPDILVVEGSPLQMGWWQGHLLRHRIRVLHERWQRALLADVARVEDGDEGGVRKRLLDLCETCLDASKHRLSERLHQELDGMAAATGLEPDDLLRLDVMRDALRMRAMGPRLTGVMGLARTDEGYEVRARWGGPDLAFLEDGWIVLHRKPAGGVESVALTWPGSLGAVAAVTQDGRGYVLAEAEVRNRRRLGFGGGRPFTIAAREALDGTRDAEGFTANVTGTMGHAGIGFSGHPAETPPVRAMSGMQVYVEPDPPQVLGDEPSLVIGPYEDPHAAGAVALREAFAAPAASNDQRWLALGSHDFPGSDQAPGAYGLRIEWRPGEATMRVNPRGKTPTEVTLHE